MSANASLVPATALVLPSASADLKAGENVIEIAGGAYALDIDYLEITPSPP